MIKPLQSIRRIASLFSCSKFYLLTAVFISTAELYAQTWPIIGDEDKIASAVSSYTSITTAEIPAGEDGFEVVPYVAFTESKIAKVKRYVNKAWENVGGNVSDGDATHLNIFSDDYGKIYLSYVDASPTGANKLAIKTYNKTSQAWEPLGSNSQNLYVSAGTVLTSVSNLSISHNNWMCFDSNNIPYVVFSEFSNGGIPFVKKFNGTAWETVGGQAISADRASSVGIAMDRTTNTPFVLYLRGTDSTLPITLYTLSAGSWTPIALPASSVNGANSGSISNTRHASIALDANNNPNIAYFNAQNSNKATVIKYDRTTSTWSLSGAISTRDATYIKIFKSLSDNLYVSYVDKTANSGSIQAAKVSKLPAGSSTWITLINTSETNFIDDPVSNLAFAAGADNKEYVVYTKPNSASVVTPMVRVFSEAAPPPPPPPAPDEIVTTPKQLESLDRGLVAVKTASGVYIGWRMFGNDPAAIAFNIYRDGTKINATPITTSTNYTDNAGTASSKYFIKPVLNGTEQAATNQVSVWAQNYLSIPLQIPPAGTTPSGETYTYSPNDASVGDLDGDGEYEIILKWDPSNAKDNSQSGYTGNVYIDAYKLNGTRLWRIDLGKNIRAGAHYTQFLVYDFDGDGRSEVAIKTADGTLDGVGTVIGDQNADHRNTGGYILTGPEFLTVFNGQTGAAIATKDYLPARGTVSSWGDNYGNRVDRFTAAVAYLDGARPSIVMGRGYYTRMVRAAWDWRDGKLTSRWVFDSNTSGNSSYAGQGNHQMSVGDSDGDGKDEIFNGSSAINDNGAGLWVNKRGHGDAMHMSDLDPSLPGQEIWMCYEDDKSYGGFGLALINAKTGDFIWGIPSEGDAGRGMAADIDPDYPGYEMWGSKGGQVFSSKGVPISSSVPSMNFGIWWDGDLSRELLDGTRIDKWNATTKKADRLFTIDSKTPVSSNNSTKSNPSLTADILGDWREEMLFRSADNSKLILFTTDIPTEQRIYTLMHDAQYRTAIAWQNSAYNQPPHPSFFLGTGMATPPTPNMFVPSVGAPAVPTILYTGPSAICEGENAVLTSSASGGNQWYKDGVAISGAINQTYTATAAGSYTVTTTNLCCASAPSAATVLSINNTPNATITAGGPLIFAYGGNVVLSVASGTGYTYKWIKDGSEIIGASSATYTATTNGTYTVLVTSGSCVGISAPVDVLTLFKLPASNFRVAATDETCKNSNNGKITITAVENLNYTATLVKAGVTTTHPFTTTLDISNLTAGSYSLCITVADQPSFKQCYNDLVVKEPGDLSVYSAINESNNTISLDMSGGKAYKIDLNGVKYSTTLNTITLPLSKGENIIGVSTDSECQGKVEKVVTLHDKIIIYPNPFEDVLNLQLANHARSDMMIEIRGLDGKLFYNQQFKNAESSLQLPLSHLNSGMYLLKLSLDNSESYYKILKK